MFIYSCGFQLFLLPYISLFQDGQDLMIPHTNVQGGYAPHVTPNLCYPSSTTEGRERLEEIQVWLGRMQPWQMGTAGRRE